MKSFKRYIIEEGEKEEVLQKCGWCGSQTTLASSVPHPTLQRICKSCDYMINAVGNQDINDAIKRDNQWNNSPYNY